MNRDGYVVNSLGHRLQVYPPLAGGGFNTGGLSDLRLVTTDSAPQATGNVEYTLNLPANAVPPPVAVFDPTDPNSFNQATSLTLFDSLGATHTGTMYFVKTATANQWTAQLAIDGTLVGRRRPCSTRTPACSRRRPAACWPSRRTRPPPARPT